MFKPVTALFSLLKRPRLAPPEQPYFLKDTGLEPHQLPHSGQPGTEREKWTNYNATPRV